MNIPKKLGIKESDFRLVFGSSHIEYDPKKNESNKSKHRYSFDEAIDIFNSIIWPHLPSPPFTVKDSIDVNGEMRSNILTVDSDNNVIFIAITMRPNEAIRIISMRPASSNEKAIFHIYAR